MFLINLLFIAGSITVDFCPNSDFTYGEKPPNTTIECPKYDLRMHQTHLEFAPFTGRVWGILDICLVIFHGKRSSKKTLPLSRVG